MQLKVLGYHKTFKLHVWQCLSKTTHTNVTYAYATAYMYHNLYEFFPNREIIKYKFVLTF